MRKITVYGKFPSLNEYVLACRKNWHAGNAMISKAEKHIISEIEVQLPKKLKPPIYIDYVFYEQNRRRDHDNVSGFFHKVFQDAVVKSGRLKDDGWNFVSGWKDNFDVDKGRPRVEITIYERCKNE